MIFPEFALPVLAWSLPGPVPPHTQVNAALVLADTGWVAWAVLVLWGAEASANTRAQRWLAAFLAVKGIAPGLEFLLAQTAEWNREFVLTQFFFGTSVVAYACWWKFIREQWPADAGLRRLGAWGGAGLAGWLVLALFRGSADLWRAWPWLVAVPVMIGALRAARHGNRWSFIAIAAATTMEWADPATVLSWRAGFGQELSFNWAQLAAIPGDTLRPIVGNGFLVVPVTDAARLWFAGGLIAVWSGVLAWNYGERRRPGLWQLPAAVLLLTVPGFVILSATLSVPFGALSRETFSRLRTLARVSPMGERAGSAEEQTWRELQQNESDLGQVFRFRIGADGQRVLLDPVIGKTRDSLPVLPLERATLGRREAYGIGPIMEPQGAVFYSAVPVAGSATDWLGVFAPVERLYVYKRPTALLGNLVIALGAIVCIASLGYLLYRRRALRQQLAREEAEAATRIKTTFLAKVSHELRTPLQSLLGYGQLLESSVPVGPGRNHLAALRQHGDLMLRLVNDLLDLSAVESGTFRLVEKPVPLAEMIRQTVESLRPRAAAKGLGLTCTTDPALPKWVFGDAERLRQIVLNLVGNAVKFTPRGRVDVTLSLLGTEAGISTVELAVADTGPGIAEEDRARLFQLFSRIDRTAVHHEGAGLGLALTAALCRSAGGRIGVESDGRSGSRFHVRLPLQPAAAPAEAIPRPASLHGQRILIVDDNTLVRELFTAWLTAQGAACATAADGVAALEKAEAADFDAVILDLAMPKLGGLEVTRRWRAQGKTWRIVGASAHAGENERAEAKAAGMDVFLVKPVQLPELAAALATASPPPAALPLQARLHAELAERFRHLSVEQGLQVHTALLRRDWAGLSAHAHYLKSSAAVVGDDGLFRHCTAIEDAAKQYDQAAAEAAWSGCAAALEAWAPVPTAAHRESA